MNEANNDLQQSILTLAHLEYSKGLNTHAFFKVNNQNLGEDLVQETFMKTWSYLVKGGEIVMMKAFLYHVLNNLIIDEYRKRKNLSLDDLLEKGYEPGDNLVAEQMERVSDKFEAKQAIQLIDKLPKTYQKVIRLRFIEDLTISEISKRTGKTKNSVTVQIHRALALLKKLHNQN